MGGRERGAALLLVLAICAILGVFLGLFVDRASREAAATRRFLSELQTRELVRGGVELALARLAADSTPAYDAPDEEWLKPFVRRSPGGEIRVAVSDEGSRLNLNAAPAAVLARLPGLGPEELDRLLAFRERWIEVPEQVRAVEGLAERWPEFGELVTAFGPLNPFGTAPEGLTALLRARGLSEGEAQAAVAQFEALRQRPVEERPETLEELERQVTAVSSGEWDRLRDGLTLEGMLNAHLAPPEVLGALWAGLGLGEESFRRVLETREKAFWPFPAALWATVGDAAAETALRPYLTVASRVFRIEVEARSGEVRVARRVIVRRSWEESGGKAKFTVLSWAEVK